MKRLCIGIIDLTPGWKVILDQMGVWYEKISDISDLSSRYSVIILNASLSEEEEQKLHEFTDGGGSVLETMGGTTFSYARFTAVKKVERLVNPKTIPFLNHIPFIDVYAKAELYNGMDNFDGIIDFEKHENGIVCNLGLDPDELIADNSFSRKRFLNKEDQHPDELVSNASKASLTELLISILKELHFQQGLPFVNKWTSPKEQPIFAFRIDSDFGTRESITKLYEVGKAHNIPMTWFLHVEAHEDWLSVFHDFKGQEIALHGYEHGTSDSYENIFNNIEKGLQVLKDADFDPQGFCVPYAIWNNSLAEVLKKFEFAYGSEFTVGYDGLPFYPLHQNEEMDSLQIPIHPICTGSLNRKHLSVNDMRDYFLKILTNKVARFEPAVFYHHPLQPGTELWNDVFKTVNELGLCTLSFSEYATFWKKRNNTSFEAYLDTESASVSLSGELNDLFLQVSGSHSAFDLVKSNMDQEVKSSGKFEYHQSSQPEIAELDQLKSGKLQLLKTSLLDWRNRKKL